MMSMQVSLTEEQKTALHSLQRETGKREDDLLQDAVRSYIDNQKARKSWKEGLKKARALDPVAATTTEKMRARVMSEKRDSVIMNEIRKAVYKKLIESY